MGTLLDGSVPKTISGEVADYGIEQADRVALRLEAGASLPQTEKGLLYGIPGVLSRPERAGGVPYQAGNFTVKQLPESVDVTRCNPGSKRHGRPLSGMLRHPGA
jgi:hypothetical protein